VDLIGGVIGGANSGGAGGGDDGTGGAGGGDDGGGPGIRVATGDADAGAVGDAGRARKAGDVAEAITLLPPLVSAIRESCIAKDSLRNAFRSCSTPARPVSSVDILLLNSVIFRTNSSLPL